MGVSSLLIVERRCEVDGGAAGGLAALAMEVNSAGRCVSSTR
jgi:hypothetical protein